MRSTEKTSFSVFLKSDFQRKTNQNSLTIILCLIEILIFVVFINGMAPAKGLIEFGTDCEKLASELIVCFNYYQYLHKVEKANREALAGIRDAEEKFPILDEKAALRRVAMSKGFELTRSFEHMKHLAEENHNKERIRIMAMNALRILDFILLILPVFLVVAVIIAYIVLKISSLEGAFVFFLAGAVSIGILAVYIIISSIVSNKFFKVGMSERLSVKERLRFFRDNQADNVIDYCESNPDVFEATLKQYNPKRLEKAQASLEMYSNERNLALSSAREKSDMTRKEVDYFKGHLYEKIKGSLVFIPEGYFSEGAITGLLFLYANRRGDTVDDLIKIYEDEKTKLSGVAENAEDMEKLNAMADSRMGELSSAVSCVSASLNSLSDDCKATYQQESKMLELYSEPKRRYEELISGLGGTGESAHTMTSVS